MMKLLPSILAALVALSGLVAPQAQSFVMAHPSLSMVLAAVYGIMSHMLPSPMMKSAEEPKA